MHHIIIEGFWGVGKTTFIKEIEGKYKIVYEPHHQKEVFPHQQDEDINNWYIKKHKDRFEEFTSEKSAVILERSILSSIAYRYAQGHSIDDMESLVSPLREYKRSHDLLLIMFYKDYEFLDEHIRRTYSQNFFNKYHEFYRVILPIRFGIVLNFINILDDSQNYISFAKIEDQIKVIVQHNRICQANIVCYKLDNDNYEFLVLKRNPEKGSFWQSITGGVHISGLLQENALRELEEELGVKGKKENLIGTDFVFWYVGKEGYELAEYVFGYRLDKTDTIKLSDEHTEFAFLPVQEAVERVKYDGNKKGIKIVNELVKQLSN